MNTIEGLRVLIVDDEALIALHAEEILLESGAIPIGPASTLGEALACVEEADFDAALLDVNLYGQSSKPVAERLAAAKIPFVVVTGYGQLDWGDLASALLAKPYQAAAVREALARVTCR